MKSIFFYLFLVLLTSAVGLLGFKKRIESKLQEEAATAGASDVSFQFFDANQTRAEAGVSNESMPHTWYGGTKTAKENDTEGDGSSDPNRLNGSNSPGPSSEGGPNSIKPATPVVSSTGSSDPKKPLEPAAPTIQAAFKYERNGDKALVQGMLPGEEELALARAALDPIRKSGVEIDDRIGVSKEVSPAEWIGVLPDLLKGKVSQMSDGVLDVGVHGVRVQGTVPKGVDPDALSKAYSEWAKNQGLKMETSLKASGKNQTTPPSANATPPASNQSSPAKTVGAVGAVGAVGSEMLSLSRKGNALTVEGTVASEKRKAEILAAAGQVAGLKVQDQLAIDPKTTATPWGSKLAGFIPTYFSGLTQGTLSQSGDGLVLAGKTQPEVAPQQIEQSAKEAFGNAPVVANLKRGTKPKGNQNPARLIVDYVNDQRVQLSGAVSSSALSENLEAVVSKSVHPNAGITNQIKASKETGRGPWVVPAVEFLPDLFATARSGRFEVGPNGPNLQAVYETDADEKALRDSFAKRFPKADAAKAVKLTQVPVAEVRNEVLSSLKDLQIYFDSNSAEVRAPERLKVEEAAAAVRRLRGEAKLIVGGHADSTGNAEYNRQLSIRRAGAVRAILIELGVPGNLMEVQSFGESGASSGADDDRRSRRVEIRIVPE